MLYMTHACTPCVDSKLFLQTDWDIVNHPRHRPTWHVQLCVRIHSRHRPKWHVQVCVCVCVCVRVRIYERSLHCQQRPFTSSKALSWHPVVCFFSEFSKLRCPWWPCFRACWILAKVHCNPWARHRCIAWRQTISALPASSLPVLSPVPDVIYVCMC